ncbi:recombinase family protein [Chromatium okenii]|jgi:DNA invertase Pin-like site-specific DNA recombinase|uniref:Recombinase family protein n=1 Tax=Chromatium okenii TaxID=61644 RepID=A0A2S7XSV3_9GAMM|nr:recombinase family protein [Chromatium okenii]PQJ94704.1 recombinase family protein [Chromatium okenii]PQJ94719.1 recombinase family protein [Chromatium okenii]PQJ96815.1 recombinase family protein [Chromatium okenii]PQJ96824.1 recombinase family protein [Chromatium okenii]
MATAIGYIRVSTSGQAIDGVSLDAQKAKIAAWAELNGYELGEIFEDAGISGTKQDRPGLAAALAAAKKGDAVIAYSISRFARSTKHLIEISESLAKREIDMVSISERIDTTSAAGKMVFRMMAVMAEFERDQVSERTKTALQHKKSKGEKTGGQVPFGNDAAANDEGVKVLTVNQAERIIINAVIELRKAGLSLRKIATELEKRGFQSRKGRVFHPTQISRMLVAA